MNSFLSACGATAPIRLRVRRQGSHDYDHYSFDWPFILIGRDPRADLVVTHPSVSKRHAYVQILPGRLYLRDLGSRVGTYVEDQRVTSCRIRLGDKFRIGPYRLRVIKGVGPKGAAIETVEPTGATQPAESTPAQFDAASEATAPEPPQVTLELTRGSETPVLYPLVRDVTMVGRATDCRVVLHDPHVSSYQFSVIRTHDGLWIVDLLGQGGVAVNGVKVRYARVFDGDEIRVGATTIRPLFDSQRERNLRTRTIHRPESAALALPWTAPASTAPGPGPPFLGGLPVPMAALPWMTPALPATPDDPAAGRELDLARQQQAGGLLPPPEWAAPYFSPMLHQINLMQQQMFDQFYNTMLVLCQTFATAQQDQQSALHAELDRLRELTHEVVTLRAELAAAPAGKAASTPTSTARAERTPPAREAPQAKQPTSRPATAAGTPPAATPNSRPAAASGPQAAPDGPRIAAREATADAAQPRRPAPAPPDPRPSDTHHDESHAELCRRLAQIQAEQLTRWQRILNLLPGQLAGKPTLY